MSSHYPITWITKNIGTGYAPQSYDDLDSIRDQGVDGIVNLCGEYSDLHTIEENAGFEVFWLAIPDETAPTIGEMEEGLEWLDEAVYLGKKILVHCRHGIGRTGTFVTAYLLRRGFALKKAEKLLKSTKALPSNYSQWKLLRKYGKQEGQLKNGEPSPENSTRIDLSLFYQRYEELLFQVDRIFAQPDSKQLDEPRCTLREGFSQPFSLELIEALYLSTKVNKHLSTKQRQEIVGSSATTEAAGLNTTPFTAANCPLRREKNCLLHKNRPLLCRLPKDTTNNEEIAAIFKELILISQDVFSELFDRHLEQPPPRVSFVDGVSGRFIQIYFDFLLSKNLS